jgi:hypothetical protein
MNAKGPIHCADPGALSADKNALPAGLALNA